VEIDGGKEVKKEKKKEEEEEMKNWSSFVYPDWVLPPRKSVDAIRRIGCDD